MASLHAVDDLLNAFDRVCEERIQETTEDLSQLVWLLSLESSAALEGDGYCRMNDGPFEAAPIGWSHPFKILIDRWSQATSDSEIPVDIYRLIIEYFGLLRCDSVVQLKSSEENPSYFLIPKMCLSLSTKFKLSDLENMPISVEVTGDILHHVMAYLSHHQGRKPEEIAKPIRSVKMERIVADQWDAHFVNRLNKKTIFQIILAANKMEIPSLC